VFYDLLLEAKEITLKINFNDMTARELQKYQSTML